MGATAIVRVTLKDGAFHEVNEYFRMLDRETKYCNRM